MAENDSNPTDRELVRAFLRSRGESAFRVLYRRHTPPLYRMAYRVVGSVRADDVLQETWCRAAQGLAQFEWRSSLGTWLTAILIRCCREVQRDRYRAIPLPLAAEADEAEIEISPANALDLERALAALAPGYREVLVLHDIEGLTHDEIARVLNVVPGTSKSQLARARRALRLHLTDTPASQQQEGSGS